MILRRRLVLVLALLLAGPLPQEARAQQPSSDVQQQQSEALAQDPLRLATEVGRYLFAYDEAANRAATMLLSENIRTERVEASIAQQHEDGHWTVGFGRLTGEGGFRLTHEVVMNDERLVKEVRTDVGERVPPNSYYARAARAQQLARDGFDGEHGPYNLLVLPGGSEAGRMTVYALPAQTDQDAYRLGGDHRFEVDPSAGEVVSREPLHRQYYEVDALPEGATGSAHEATRPVETDVLFAAVRRPKAPHFVMTEGPTFRIAPDGAITTVEPGTVQQRGDVTVLGES